MSRGGKRVGWLRRNGRALLAVLVLLPVTVGIMFANQWIRYFEEWPSRPVNAAVGETLEYGNARWRIESTARVSADSAAGRERDLPAGTDLISVTVEVDPTGTGPDGVPDLCTARLEESGGGTVTRSWSNGSRGALLGGAGPLLTSCSSDLSTRYSFEAEFVVPAEAGESSSLTVNIAVPGFLPEYGRFALD
ncbi:hypothetical protein [Cryobacterium sp. N22]|uniref:hypothetical protein n=1 Tax=Cryobacterium sp. N22 TaxID=2048290 RepID=UPI0011AFE3EE|nr:hypothetical protein [Cryobacterium sp. N22]